MILVGILGLLVSALSLVVRHCLNRIDALDTRIIALERRIR